MARPRRKGEGYGQRYGHPLLLSLEAKAKGQGSDGREKMTRKDFWVIALALKKITENDTAQERRSKAEDFAFMLIATNPRFDKDKFLTACGVEKEGA